MLQQQHPFSAHRSTRQSVRPRFYASKRDTTIATKQNVKSVSSSASAERHLLKLNGEQYAAHRVSPEKLRWTFPLDNLPFNTTSDLVPCLEVIGQQRALKAIKLGLDMKFEGYNVFVTGKRLPTAAHISAFSYSHYLLFLIMALCTDTIVFC